MTLEEKFNQDVWWILQEIRKDNYLTPKGQKVEFSLRSLPKTKSIRRKDVNYGFPQEEVQRKLLFKLQEWKALDVQPVDNILRGSDIFNPRIYDLTIKQPKFDELYKKYEIANSSKETEQWVKPILRKIENGKLPYKKDGLFYSLWKYANAGRLTGKSLIAFMDLAPLEGNPRFAIFEFLNNLQELKIELEDITFHEDIYKKYCKTEHDYITDYITKNPEADFSKAVKKLFKNQATFEDIFKILGKFDELVKMKLQLNGLLEFVEFSPSPSAKNIKPLKEHVEIYSKCFIEDKLFSSELKNFYRFSRQKEIFLQQIEREVEDYGLEFVFRQGESISVSRGSMASIGKDEGYLFIHILAALEKQDYFEIESILITDMDVPPEKQTDDYKVKILASEKLLEEYEPKTSHAHEQIQKIEITAMPKLQVENVGENAHAKGKKRESPIELSFPESVQWDKVMLKIKNGRQEVEIFYDNSHIITADYRQLRFFVGKRQQKPDRQWGFLCTLATLAATDIKQATAENMRSMITQNKMLSANNVQQVKKLFVERLQDIFKTSDDPFHDKRDYYEPKFKILPEPALRQEKIWSQRLHENRSHEPKFISDKDSETSYEDNEEEAL